MLQALPQDSFNAGIVREFEGQRIPPNGLYDVVNGLLDDDQAVYRRGGDSLFSAADAAVTLLALSDLLLSAGQRAVMWDARHLYALDGSSNPVALQTAASDTFGTGRSVIYQGMLVFPPIASNNLAVYGGSLKTANYSTGSVNLTAGSATVSGNSTAWSANVDPGMILMTSATSSPMVVQEVTSNTSLKLRQSSPVTQASALYSLQPSNTAGGSAPLFADAVAGIPTFLGVAGTRLLQATGTRLAFTGLGTFVFDATDYHEFEGRIIGLDGIGNTAIVFTTNGVWTVGNMAYDLTDELGNIQQTVSKAAELVLWGNPGIAKWRDGLIVPAMDDVYAWAPGSAAVSIGEAVRPLYRSYVNAGYKPGVAAVYRSHYFLPILNGTTWVDTLVCRLDGKPPGWTRWDGHAGASLAFAGRVDATTGKPGLLGLSGKRVTSLSGCFVPAASNKNEADGSTHQMTLITRDFAVKRVGSNLFKYLRARYELQDAASDNPTLTLEYQVGSHDSAWVAVTGNAPESDGTDSFQWWVDHRSQAIRFRIRSVGPTAKCVLRSLEVWFRQSGKR